MKSYKEINVNIKDKLAIITLNRPSKKNAINAVMYEEVTEALNELSQNENISITALTGAGDYYCSGTDLIIPNVDSYEQCITESSARVRAFVNAFINHKRILVAVVNGPAIGIAVTTLALCDVVYCSDTSTFQTPFTSLGLSAEGCSSYTLPFIMGVAKANEMLLFNYKMTAAEALRVGLVAQIYTKQQMNSELWPELQTKANQLPVNSLIYTKQLMRHFHKNKLQEANGLEFDRLEERWRSEDFFNAIIRFRNRSKM